MKAVTIGLALACVLFCSALYADQSGANIPSLNDAPAASGFHKAFDPASQRTTNTWDGSYNTNWHNSLNWSLNRVPLGTDDVIIPDGLANYPMVTAGAECNILLTYGYTSLTITQEFLHVRSDASLYGTLSMDWSGSGGTPVLIVEGDLTFAAGSSVEITQENASSIYAFSDVQFNSGSNVNMTSGYLVMTATGHGYIRTHAPTTIHHLRSDKDSPYVCGFSSDSSASLTIGGNLEVYEGSGLSQLYTGTTILKGNLVVQSGGTCMLNYGTLSLEGIANSYINLGNAGNYVNNLRINKTGAINYTVYLSSPLEAKGNVSIDDGVLSGRTQTFPYVYHMLTLGGNWNNNVSPSAFSNGSLTLNGSGTQTMSSETLRTLRLDKSAGTMVIPSGSEVVCNSYDWVQGAYVVNNGSFTALDLADPGIFGDITLAYGEINYHQDTNAGSYVDLRGDLNISGGVFTINGGIGPAFFSYIDPASLTMGGGELDFKNVGIIIPSNYGFVSNIMLGVIKTTGSFEVTGGNFNPTGGLIELYGSVDSQVSHAAGSNLCSLKINKSSTGREEQAEWRMDRDGNQILVTRNNTITATSNLDLNGGFTLDAGTFVAPPEMKVETYWENNVGESAFVEGTGLVIFEGSEYGNVYTNSVIQTDEAFYALKLDKSTLNDRLTIADAVDVSCESYEWIQGSLYCTGGTFTALDLINPGIYGLINLSAGTINFHQDSAQRIDMNASLTISNGTFNVHGGSTGSIFGYGAADASITMSGGILDFKDVGIVLSYLRPVTTEISGGRIRTTGSFTAEGNFSPTGGVVELYGGGYYYAVNSITPPTNFHDLEINKTNGTIEGSGILYISGNLSILSGTFIATPNIYIGGNWLLNSGAVFDADGGTVSFEKIGDLQSVYGNNTFYNVIDAHTGNALTFQAPTVIAGTLSVTNLVTFHNAATLNTVLNNQAAGQLVFYGSHVSSISSYTGGGALRSLNAGNHVIVNDLAQNGLYGSFLANAGHLEFHQDPSSFTIISGTYEIINDGIIDLYGGNTGALFAQNGNVSFSMDSGEFNIRDGGLTITNTTYTCGFDISGGTLRVNGSWLDQRSYAVFDPGGGTVEFTGSGDNYVSPHPSGWFQHLKVNKATTLSSNLLINSCIVRGGLSIEAANVVYLGGEVSSLNSGDVLVNSGTLDLNGNNLISTGNILVNGTLALDTGSELRITSVKALTVNSGGSLQTTGGIITHNGTGYYALNIESGASISAVNTTFEYMNTSGLNIKDGAWVDPDNSLDYCTFRNGAITILGGKLLSINNGQHLVITGASFPNLPVNPANNVAKTLD
ncbi:MAG: hypothetical protein K0B87_04895 [Candidatus Syntrophosphaera sp.]|nr:hypothetical protein [Candidatus Syntrophosphaera sp.]